MIDFKDKIAEKIGNIINMDIQELKSYIEIPKDSTMGDYAFPCFRLAKELKKAPNMIANELKDQLAHDEVVEKIEVEGGYLNYL